MPHTLATKPTTARPAPSKASVRIRPMPNARAGTEACWECGKVHVMREVRALAYHRDAIDYLATGKEYLGAVCLECLQEDDGELGARLWNSARRIARSVGSLDVIGWRGYSPETAKEIQKAAEAIAKYMEALEQGADLVEGTAEALAAAPVAGDRALLTWNVYPENCIALHDSCPVPLRRFFNMRNANRLRESNRYFWLTWAEAHDVVTWLRSVPPDWLRVFGRPKLFLEGPDGDLIADRPKAKPPARKAKPAALLELTATGQGAA